MASKIKYLAVFCGSATGQDPEVIFQTELLAKTLVHEGYGLVYGGASVGLMGLLADTVLAHGGSVLGVIPSFFDHHEIAHLGLTELRYVDSLAERKQVMIDASEAFIVLPGGYGTLDELFEVLTLAQLDRHQKATVIINVGGYYDALKQQLETMMSKGWLKPEHYQMLRFVQSVPEVFESIRLYQHPEQRQWIQQITQTPL